jgi:hypothetical protein
MRNNDWRCELDALNVIPCRDYQSASPLCVRFCLIHLDDQKTGELLKIHLPIGHIACVWIAHDSELKRGIWLWRELMGEAFGMRTTRHTPHRIYRSNCRVQRRSICQRIPLVVRYLTRIGILLQRESGGQRESSYFFPGPERGRASEMRAILRNAIHHDVEPAA